MSQSKNIGSILGRAVLGAVAGTVSCLTLIAFVDTALSYIPDDKAGRTLFLLGAGVGGTAGAVLATVNGSQEIRGWPRDIIIGILAGCLAGLLGAVVYAGIASGFATGFLTGKFQATYRWTGLSIGIPTGSILGGIVGFVVSVLRQRKPGA